MQRNATTAPPAYMSALKEPENSEALVTPLFLQYSDECALKGVSPNFSTFNKGGKI